MNSKKRAAAFIALILVAGLLAGCGKSGAEAGPESGDLQDVRTAYDRAYRAFDPDEIVLTAAGADVPWGEFFYWVVNAERTLENASGGEVTDWNAACALDPSLTNGAYVLREAAESAAERRVIESRASEIGAALTDEDLETLRARETSDIETYGGGDSAAFEEYLAGIYLRRKDYDYLNKTSFLYPACFRALYGEDGAACPDEEVMAYAGTQGYMRAKHILFLTMDAEGEPLPADEEAAKRAAAEQALAELRLSSADIEAAFDQYIDGYNEDTSEANYPDGYVFGPGKMQTEFEEGTAALSDYEISDIVETSYGYHIILRLPLKAENIVGYFSDGSGSYTLRYEAAINRFNAVVKGWFASAETVWSEKFSSIDLAELFA